MAIRDVFKVSRKTFINLSAWLDYPALAAYTRTIADVLRAQFTLPKAQREETFEQALARQRIPESDVNAIAKTYRQFALFFLALGCLAFLYGFFILFRYYTFTGWLLAMSVTAIFFSQAFRFDFWSLQMRKRKLGLSFADWQESVLGKSKKR